MFTAHCSLPTANYHCHTSGIGYTPGPATLPDRRDPIMSARLLAVLILPTLLLAVALTPSRAAQPPAEPAKAAKHGKAGKAQMVQKVYKVTDLVIPILACPEPASSQNGAWSVPVNYNSYSPVAAYQRASGKACKQTSGEPNCTQSGENELIALIKNT